MVKKMHICEHGCGQTCTNRFVQGHQNIGKPSGNSGKRAPFTAEQKNSWVNFCQCNCGQKCNKKYLPGHNSKGKHTNLGKKGHAAWNKGLTKETDARVAEYSRKVSIAQKGVKIPWNKDLTKEMDERLRIQGEKHKGYYLSEKTLQKMRNASIGKRYSLGTKRTDEQKQHMHLGHIKSYKEHGDEIIAKRMAHGWKKFPYIFPDGTIKKMRSSWEVLYAEYLDNLGIIWQYEPRQFKLSNGKRYWPDFYLSEKDEYHEIKGWLSPVSKGKMDLFQIEYPEVKFKLLDKNALLNLGVI